MNANVTDKDMLVKMMVYFVNLRQSGLGVSLLVSGKKTVSQSLHTIASL